MEPPDKAVSWRVQKPAGMYGRLLLGASAVLYGVVSLIWRDSDMWQRLLPIHGQAGTFAGWLLVALDIIAGIAVMVPRTVRPGALAIGFFYGLTVLACIGGMIAAPRDPGNYINGFEQFAIVCGAIALFASTESDVTRAGTLRRIARFGLAVCSLSFAWAQWLYFTYTASLVPTWIPPGQVFWTGLTTVAFALAALALLINRQARLAAQLEAVMMGLFGVIVWIPIIAAKPSALADWNEIAANYLITAAAWIVAGT